MKTPAKDYISALKIGSYLASTPSTLPSSPPQPPALTDICIISNNPLMIKLEEQNVRLMEMHLDLLGQMLKLR